MLLEIVGSQSLCTRARKMIAEGADPTEPAEWTRGGVLVFTVAKPLGWWAEREVDGRTRLLRRQSADMPAPAAKALAEVL